MKALVLEANGELVLRERPMPVAKAGEVVVKVHACGVCGSDMGRLLNNGAYHYPLIPGHEFAGTVAQVGPGVTTAHEGDPVTVFPMLPCGVCDACKTGKFNLCHQYDYFGSRRDGAFCEYVAVPEWNVLVLPKELPLEVAAMSEPVAVALHAIKQGRIQVGDTVGIAGMGTIGMILSRLAKLAGAGEVIAWDIDPRKIAFSKEMGNQWTFDASTDNIADEVQKVLGRRLDVAIEGTGSSAGLEACILSLKNHGNLVALGNPGGDLHLEKAKYSALMRREITLRGTWNSDRLAGVRDDWETVIQILTKDQDWFRRLISHRYRLEDELEPLHFMQARKEFYCKVMYVMEEQEQAL